ncbi:hypothetical protein, partial [Cryobacterium sp. MDB2-A-2]|uniref:hypothetical protein n=2 Tax=unclassified Cryobacterium TaxID=2649013 RepID=UPI001A7E46DD
MHNRSPKDDVLVGGLDDWAYAAWVYGSTRLSGLEDPGLRRVKGHEELPTGGHGKCPLMAMKTAHSWPTDLPT